VARSPFADRAILRFEGFGVAFRTLFGGQRMCVFSSAFCLRTGWVGLDDLGGLIGIVRV
jgi:hypothetical protein